MILRDFLVFGLFVTLWLIAGAGIVLALRGFHRKFYHGWDKFSMPQLIVFSIGWPMIVGMYAIMFLVVKWERKQP